MIREKKFHIALPRPPAALAICAKVFSRRKAGEAITSLNLPRFDGRPSASFCRISTQYNLYIATATDNISHSLFPHATSSLSRVLFGAVGQNWFAIAGFLPIGSQSLFDLVDRAVAGKAVCGERSAARRTLVMRERGTCTARSQPTLACSPAWDCTFPGQSPQRRRTTGRWRQGRRPRA
jgi:hypothetical protein